MIRKVKDGNAEIVECDLDPIVTGRILEGIVNMNAAIVSLLGLPVAATADGGSGSTDGSPSATTDVTIALTGKAASGKSTVAELVYDFLKSQGINCELRDHDHPDRQADLEKRVDAVKRKGTKFVVLAANRAIECGGMT